jgi:hypothetical protein
MFTNLTAPSGECFDMTNLFSRIEKDLNLYCTQMRVALFATLYRKCFLPQRKQRGEMFTKQRGISRSAKLIYKLHAKIFNLRLIAALATVCSV